MPTAFEKAITTVSRWPLRRGKRELLQHLEGGKDLTRTEAMLAKCYDCCCGYDNAIDCNVPTCALYPWMPYRDGGPRKRTMSEERKALLAVRLNGGADGEEATDDSEE